jgi:hypothetical protein
MGGRATVVGDGTDLDSVDNSDEDDDIMDVIIIMVVSLLDADSSRSVGDAAPSAISAAEVAISSPVGMDRDSEVSADIAVVMALVVAS